MDASIGSGRAAPPRSRDARPARCSSHSMRTPAAPSTRFTAGTWSKPMPPPCTSVTRQPMHLPLEMMDQLLRDRRGVAVATEIAGEAASGFQRPADRRFDALGGVALAYVLQHQR